MLLKPPPPCRSLTQTAGRAARNVNGKVILYADKITESMRLTIAETTRRREKQMNYNKEHGITPKQIEKALNTSLLVQSTPENELKPYSIEDRTRAVADPVISAMTPQQLDKAIARTRRLMNEAASRMDFMEAAQYRDEMFKLEALKERPVAPNATGGS